jgi:hypothetical protein
MSDEQAQETAEEDLVQCGACGDFVCEACHSQIVQQVVRPLPKPTESPSANLELTWGMALVISLAPVGAAILLSLSVMGLMYFFLTLP